MITSKRSDDLLESTGATSHKVHFSEILFSTSASEDEGESKPPKDKEKSKYQVSGTNSRFSFVW
jgi:hypothetical protein